MAFNFGGGTPAPAPAAAAGGGFAFAAAPAPAPAPAAAAPAGGAPAPAAGGFAFGGAAPAAGAAPAPAAGGAAFGFGGAAPAAAPTAPAAPAAAAPAPAAGVAGGFGFGAAPTTPAAPAPAPAAAGGGLFGASTAAPAPAPAAAPGAAPANAPTAGQPTPAATVPPYHAAFPCLVLDQRIREVLGRVTAASPDAGGSSGGSSNSSTSGGQDGGHGLDAQELLYLLQTNGGTAGGTGNGGGEGPVGHLLSNPKPLQFVQPDAALRQRLRANPYVLLQRDGAAGAGSGDANSSAAGGTVAGMTPPILSDIETLSTELRLSETDAAALYAGASDVTNRRWLEGRLDRSFVGAAVAAGRANDDRAAANGGNPQQQQQQQPVGLSAASSADAAAGTGAGTATAATAASYEDDPLSPPRFGDDVLRAARELYFHERSCLLSSLLLLIRARVGASARLLQEEGADGGAVASARAVLRATDQLVEDNLVDHLVQLARDLTTKIATVGREVADGRARKKAAAAAPPPAPAVPAPSPFGVGAFGAAAPQPAPAAATAAAAPAVCDMDHALLAFAYQSRQTVAECLFYLAYHTQLTGKEVGSIIDLVRDLTNGVGWERTQGGVGCGLPVPDPIRDAPNVYAGALAAPSQYGGGGAVSPTAPAEKDVAAWEAELVGNLWDGAGSKGALDSVGPGIPQLLQCTSTLVMAVLCALDPGQVLMDRKTHGPNAFGVGNAILPPPGDGGAVASDTAGLQEINRRLDMDSIASTRSWRRQDIAGLLCGACALLLQPSAVVLTSPRMGGRSPSGFAASPRRGGGSVDIRRAYRSCLEAPFSHKSLTYARVSLLPSFGTSTSRHISPSSGDGGAGSAGGEGGSLSSNFDFYMSVLSEFSSRYLDAISSFGELPVTRAHWYDDEKKNIEFARVQEEQRQQFGTFSGVQQRPPTTPLKTEPDVTERFDCLDDVVALAVAVCSVCPDCAHQFWSTVEEQEQGESGTTGSTRLHLAPSRVLMKLEQKQAGEDSLLPTYLSFLAAVALANAPGEDDSRNGAELVHQLLMGGVESANFILSPGGSSNRSQVTWQTLLDLVAYYADELSRPASTGESSKSVSDGFRRSASGTYEIDGAPSTAYYCDYVADNATDGQSASFSRGGDQGGSENSSATSSRKRFELDEQDRFTLLSILTLISNVSSRCTKARFDILAISAAQSDSGIGGPTIQTIFALALCPLPADIRGLAFVATANLIRAQPNKLSSEQDKEKALAQGKEAWRILERTQILPIGLLGQYAPMPDASRFTAAPGVPDAEVRCIMESGSNYYENEKKTARAAEASSSAWFPSSSEYGIVSEMEHVEAVEGSYPATEGLLYLITSLVQTVGCPSNTGSDWRPRPGCTPYIEYVIDFVLPRATGSTNTGKSSLFFATPADKYRLVSRALEVVEAVIVRYMVPADSSSKDALSSSAVLGANNPSNQRQQQQKQPLSLESMGHNYESSLRHASEQCALALVTSKIFPVVEKAEDLNQVEMQDSLRDYRNEQLSLAPAQNAAPETTYAGGSYSAQQFNATPGFHTPPSVAGPAQTNAAVMDLQSMMVPCPKSPGFTVLASILSSERGNLFQILARLLIESDGARGVGVHAQEDYSRVLAMATFGDTSPVFAYSKMAIDEQKKQDAQSFGASLRTEPPQTPKTWVPAFMRPLFPPRSHALFSSQSNVADSYAGSHDGATWRELSILLSLRILCAAAGREEAFDRAVHGTPTTLSVVPVLQFRAPIQGSFVSRVLETYDVNVVRLSQLLLDSAGQRAFPGELTPAIAQYVGYRTCSLTDDEDMAKAAMSIVTYLTGTLSHEDLFAALCGRSFDGGNRLAQAFARRLLMPTSSSTDPSTTLPLPTGIKGLRHLTIDLALYYLPYGDSENLSHVLLGLSGQSFSVTTAQGKRIAVPEVMRMHNCLDAALHLISDLDFVLSPDTSSLAAKCYELICMLYSSSDVSVKASVMLKLRGRDFWYKHLLRFLSTNHPGHRSAVSILQVAASRSLTSNGDASSDYDTLHCIAWVLKGCALELHALAGHLHSSAPMQDNSNMAAVFAPQPTKCKRLLSLLLAHPHNLLLQTMIDMPMVQPGVAHNLGAATPSRELIQAAQKTMDGPADVAGGHILVDPVALVSLLRIHNSGTQGGDRSTTAVLPSLSAPTTEQELAAVEWAMAWNAYSKFSCASSHLANAWGLVMGSSLVSCRSFVLQDATDTLSSSAPLIGIEATVQLLCALLSRLSSDPNRQSSRLETGVALPLSAVVLQLITFLTDVDSDADTTASAAAAANTSNNTGSRNPNASQTSVEKEDMVKICTLVCAAIASCSSGADVTRNYERATILSCGLVDILSAMRSGHGAEAFGEKMLFRSSWGEHDAYLNAAALLLQIASERVSSDHSTIGANTQFSEKERSMVLAARSGFTALITYFDWLESKLKEQVPTFADSFLLRVYTFDNNRAASPETTAFARLGSALESYDVDAAFILQQIASCRTGTYFLLNMGITTALVSAATKYAKEAYGPGGGLDEIVERETYGAREVQAPEFLRGHLLLLNTMLSLGVAELAPPARQKLLYDAAQIIQWYSATFDRLIRSFPKDMDLVTELFTCLHLIASSLSQRSSTGPTDTIATGLENMIDPHVLSRLERRAIDLAFHLAEYPFPGPLLPSIPTRLASMERAKLSQNTHVSISVSRGSSWWNLLSDVDTQASQSIHLPDPPTGLGSGSAWGSRFGINSGSSNGAWTVEKYDHAIAAAKCLEACLLYLEIRAEGSSTLPLDGLSLSKGICRCSDAARSISERLEYLGHSNAADVASRMSASLNAQSLPANHAEEAERCALQILGPGLGRNASNLLALAYAQSKNLEREFVARHGTGTSLQIQSAVNEFTSCIMPALEHTQIESKGIGANHEFNKTVARKLRDELESLSRGLM